MVYDPFVATLIFHSKCSLSRDRFLLLLHFIRFADYSKFDEDPSPLQKILPFVSLVKESLLLFKGRLHFKQYIPSKRRRFGIKIYILCEIDTGYTINFCFHTTKAEHDKFASFASSLSVSERIVVHLCDRYLDLGHKIYADNWFNSVRLANFLLNKRTFLIGTIRPNRGVPVVLKSETVATRSTSFVRSGSILLSKFCDKKSSGLKIVYIIDTLNVANI